MKVVTSIMLKVVIDGLAYTDFTRFTVERNIEHAVAKFMAQAPHDVEKYTQISGDSTIQAYLNNKLILTGYVEEVDVDTDSDAETFTISGSDYVADLVDSTLGAETELKGPITLDALVKYVNTLLGRRNGTKVINATGTNFTFQSEEKITASADTTVFAFLEKYARKKQCFLTSDNHGNLLITRQASVVSGVTLKHYLNDTKGENNMPRMRFNLNNRERYGVYRVHAQYNPSGAGKNKKPKQVQHIVGEARDPDMREWRVLDIMAESEHVSVAELQQRAQWEATTRKARAITYEATVLDYAVGGVVLEVNQLINTIDEAYGLNQLMLVKDITYYKSDDNDSFTTSLSLTMPDAYLPDPLSNVNYRRQRNEQLKQAQLRGEQTSLQRTRNDQSVTSSRLNRTARERTLNLLRDPRNRQDD